MENKVSMGMNRTGVQMAPRMAEDVEMYAKFRLGEGSRDGEHSAEMHRDYIHEADAVGSVPLPGTMKGVAQTAASALTGTKASVLIDKLGERLAFERTGVRLYEALIVKCSAMDGDESAGGTVIDEALLQEICSEEQAHFQMLAECLKKLGADPTAMTPCADVAGVAAMGWLQVISDPRTTMAQALNTMLAVELTDNAAWELLAELASAAGHASLAQEFAAPAEAERRHLAQIKDWLKNEVLAEL